MQPGLTPSLAGGADAVTAIVIIVGARGVPESAVVGSGAPGVVGQESIAKTAAIAGLRAANRDTNTGVVGSAKGETGLGADAVTAVVEVGAVGLGDALAGGVAEGEVGGGSDAVTASIVGDTTRWDGDARVGDWAPGLTGGADAVTALVVVVQTSEGDFNTGGASAAPDPAGHDGVTGTAAVVQLTANRDGNASVVLGAD